jgi:hypothetical protein
MALGEHIESTVLLSDYFTPALTLALQANESACFAAFHLRDVSLCSLLHNLSSLQHLS